MAKSWEPDPVSNYFTSQHYWKYNVTKYCANTVPLLMPSLSEWSAAFFALSYLKESFLIKVERKCRRFIVSPSWTDTDKLNAVVGLQDDQKRSFPKLKGKRVSSPHFPPPCLVDPPVQQFSCLTLIMTKWSFFKPKMQTFSHKKTNKIKIQHKGICVYHRKRVSETPWFWEK